MKLDKLDMFGRVHIDNDTHAVIGRSLKTGALVKAAYQPNYAMGRPLVRQLPSRVTVCGTMLRDARYASRSVVELTLGNRAISIVTECAESCGGACSGWPGLDRCQHWLSNGTDDAIRAAIADHDAIAARHTAARRLPLIVLAGLK